MARKKRKSPIEFFFALDVETANRRRASICQIGLVGYTPQDGITSLLDQFVNPEEPFEPWQSSRHGIGAIHVASAPLFPQIAPALCDMLAGQIVVSHTPFDESAINKALDKYGLPPLVCTWLDSCEIARYIWGLPSNTLDDLCAALGVGCLHHDASHDARSAAEIILHALQATDTTIGDWTKRRFPPLDQPLAIEPAAPHVEEPRSHHLDGVTIVFTGHLSMPRTRAESLAIACGCRVTSHVSPLTNYVVVGYRDADAYGGDAKSNKLEVAEKLAAAGHPVKIITEAEFLELVAVP